MTTLKWLGFYVKLVFQSQTERHGACLQKTCVKQKRATYLKRTECGWSGGSLCTGSRLRVRFRIFVKVGFGFGQREGSQSARDLCQIKEGDMSEAYKVLPGYW